MRALGHRSQLESHPHTQLAAWIRLIFDLWVRLIFDLWSLILTCCCRCSTRRLLLRPLEERPVNIGGTVRNRIQYPWTAVYYRSMFPIYRTVSNSVPYLFVELFVTSICWKHISEKELIHGTVDRGYGILITVPYQWSSVWGRSSLRPVPSSYPAEWRSPS